MRPLVLAVVLSLFLALFVFARQDKQAVVSSPTVTLRDSLSPRQALREVSKQTGIAIADSLPADSPAISLDLRQAPFWLAVDSVARSAKAKAIQSSRDGSIALQPLANDESSATVSHDGPFRVRVVQLTSSRALESNRSSCLVALEVGWTPTLRPLFVESVVQQLRLTDGKGKKLAVAAEGSSLVPVDGRFSLPLELSLPGFPRQETHLGALAGKLVAIAPSKMLRFDFDNDLATQTQSAAGGAQRRRVLDQVGCEVGKVVLGRESWSVEVLLDYPDGTHKLESFQAGSLVANNDCVLVSKDGKLVLRSTNYVIDQVGSRRARVTYHFADRPGARRGKASDWRLSYSAPARLVEVAFSFSFEKLPLP